MDDFETFDPALFGLWAERAGYGETARMEDTALADKVRGVLLETKSAEASSFPVSSEASSASSPTSSLASFSPAEEFRRLLNEMTVEMREQFSAFRRMRTSAEKALENGDEAAGKLARADVKAATDAMSLIVRTLEKVDSLQRQLARDRELEAERRMDENGYEDAVREVERLIDERAQERFERWKREGRPGDDDPGGAGGDRPQPPDTG